MRQVTKLELTVADVLNALGLAVFWAVVVAGAWCVQNWRPM